MAAVSCWRHIRAMSQLRDCFSNLLFQIKSSIPQCPVTPPDPSPPR